ncbi:hypothetical protein EDB86DRAFT_2954705 [Lactarius hatsudake]|nr:hypothetical protein EDB86DRAFT_2954705 [Lactarius hatsudake]
MAQADSANLAYTVYQYCAWRGYWSGMWLFVLHGYASIRVAISRKRFSLVSEFSSPRVPTGSVQNCFYICHPQVIKDVSASSDAIWDHFELSENFLRRLDIYSKIPPTITLVFFTRLWTTSSVCAAVFGGSSCTSNLRRITSSKFAQSGCASQLSYRTSRATQTRRNLRRLSTKTRSRWPVTRGPDNDFSSISIENIATIMPRRPGLSTVSHFWSGIRRGCYCGYTENVGTLHPIPYPAYY